VDKEVYNVQNDGLIGQLPFFLNLTLSLLNGSSLHLFQQSTSA